MENRSKHYGDVEKWVEKVIDSCETYQQTITASILIRNFEKQMNRNDEYSNLSWSIKQSLTFMLNLKRNKIMDRNEMVGE
jgi:deoxyhypusine synthase